MRSATFHLPLPHALPFDVVDISSHAVVQLGRRYPTACQALTDQDIAEKLSHQIPHGYLVGLQRDAGILLETRLWSGETTYLAGTLVGRTFVVRTALLRQHAAASSQTAAHFRSTPRRHTSRLREEQKRRAALQRELQDDPAEN